MNPIIEKAEALWGEGLSISSIRASRSDVGWDVNFSINVFVPLGEGEMGIVGFDEPGVKVGGWERYPDQKLTIYGSEEGISELMRQVADEGRALDMARFDAEAPNYPQFVTKPAKWYRAP